MEEIEQIPIPQPENDIPSTPEVSGDLPVVEGELKCFAVAGFWRRVFAFMLDGAILAIPLIIIGFAFRDLAFSLGPWGRIFGYGIAFLYFGSLNSKLGRGQTIGKKIMKLVVVDTHGSYLSVGNAMLRALVLVLIFMLNGWAVPFSQNPIFVVIAATIVFGGELAVMYALIFNRTTRQLLHDLIVKSYVVKAAPEPGMVAPISPRKHIWISCGLAGLGLVIGIAGLLVKGGVPTLGIVEPGDFKQMAEIQSALLKQGDYFNVDVGRYTTQQLGNPVPIKTLTISMWTKKSCTQAPEDCHQMIMQAANMAFKGFDHINDLTGMRITVINAFDLGLATGNYTTGIAWTIDDWRKNLAQ